MIGLLVPYAVTEHHVLVPRSGRGTLAVTFDDAYVWSFSTPRDGTWTPRGWRVRWPAALRGRLHGTTRVALVGTDEVHHEQTVAFGDSDEPLALRDRHGNPLAVDSAGHLTRVFSETGDDIRAQVVEGTRQALADLRSLGYDAHLSYGCLLGAVRDGRMIGHDSDADLAYLSRADTPAQVVYESYAMERELRRLGWRVVRMSGADLKLMHRLADGRVVHIDIFGGFHVGGTYYQLGGRSGPLPVSALSPAGIVTLEGVELPAPADPEAVLAFLYGPSWRTPDPAFQNDDPPGGLRRIEGWVRGVRHDVVPWNEYYREHRKQVPWQPSSFAKWTAKRIPPGAPIADLGCGTGRDASWFTRQGRLVLAYDASGTALRQTRRRIVRSGGTEDQARTLALNDRRSALAAGAELARIPDPVHLYARGLVGCLNPEALDHLFLIASMALRRGGSLLLEFSTDWSHPSSHPRPVAEHANVARGAGVRSGGHMRHIRMFERGVRRPKPTPGHLVERVAVDRVIAGITARGGIVDEVTVERGTDLFDRPDPKVARIVAHWNHPNQEASA
ncbi:class I SAM-dependent methyltransferase [Nocardioides marmoriginsengisoli]|uniref:Class I SAM-dependent methyltransferase n=1 Tax=Nocardioides marmoriginsengisoli TaxID=661483 RepID=A0A3N0CNY3_9ACTN|nr:class I SAM-dependent methyltransferase [Nocardioides marmoriginsengisoli]RNL65168.1 class I SAM-dependent methyltransferase [Nocardioides marmoriginsengisoli]